MRFQPLALYSVMRRIHSDWNRFICGVRQLGNGSFFYRESRLNKNHYQNMMTNMIVNWR